MSGYINPEGKVMQLFYKITETMLLSILWVIASVPVVTIGASSAALYYAFNKVVKEDCGYAWGEFWNGFRMNFKQATPVWLGALVICAGLAADIFVMLPLAINGERGDFFWIFFMILLGIAIMWMVFIFAYMARFEDNTKTILKNSFWIYLMHFMPALLLLVILVVEVAVVIIFPITLPIAAFFFPGGFTCIANMILEKIFKKYRKDEEPIEDEENWEDLETEM